MRNIQDNAFAMRAVLIVGIAILGILIVLFLWYVLHVVLLVFAGLLLALLLGAPAGWISSRAGLPRRLSLFLVIGGLAAILVIGGWLIIPRFIQQLGELSQVLPLSIDRIRQYLAQYSWGVQILDKLPPISDMRVSTGNIFARLFGIFSGAFGIVAGLFVLLFIGIFFSMRPEAYVGGVIKLFPRNMQGRVNRLLNDLGDALKWWIIGQLFSMAILGVIVGVGLWLMGVPLALSLGILCGIFSFVPIIGSILALIPAALIAVTQGPVIFVYVLLLYCGAQMVETYLLTPLIQQRAVSMPPALGLVAQLLMGVLAGPLGVALAFPIAVVALVLVKKLHVERIKA